MVKWACGGRGYGGYLYDVDKEHGKILNARYTDKTNFIICIYEM